MKDETNSNVKNDLMREEDNTSSGSIRIIRRRLKRKRKILNRGYRHQAKLGSYRLSHVKTMGPRSSCAAAMICIESKLLRYHFS